MREQNVSKKANLLALENAWQFDLGREGRLINDIFNEISLMC